MACGRFDLADRFDRNVLARARNACDVALVGPARGSVLAGDSGACDFIQSHRLSAARPLHLLGDATGVVDVVRAKRMGIASLPTPSRGGRGVGRAFVLSCWQRRAFGCGANAVEVERCPTFDAHVVSGGVCGGHSVRGGKPGGGVGATRVLASGAAMVLWQTAIFAQAFFVIVRSSQISRLGMAAAS